MELTKKQEQIIKEIESNNYKIVKPRLSKTLSFNIKPTIKLEGTTEYLKKFKWVARYNGMKVIHLVHTSQKMLEKILEENRGRVEDVIILVRENNEGVKDDGGF